MTDSMVVNDVPRAALVTAPPTLEKEPLSLEAQKMLMRQYTGPKRKPEMRARAFISSIPQIKREMSNAGVADAYVQRQVTEPNINEQRPPFDSMHICRRGSDVCGVFTTAHLEQLKSCGFEHVENVVFYGPNAVLPFVPLPVPVRRAEHGRVEVDATIEEPDEPHLPSVLPQFDTINDVISTMERPFRIESVVYSSLLRWGDDAGARKRNWQSSGCCERIASIETQYKQRLQLYWAFHSMERWVRFPRTEKLPTPIINIIKAAAKAKDEDTPAGKKPTWMEAAKAIFAAKVAPVVSNTLT
jgi:hypothetical protein